MIFHNDAVAEILLGDCLASLQRLGDRSVNCAITSPPYFGLRDYGHEGQIGLEETPDAYVERLVAVFREVRRVLTDDGTLWLNIGDSYAAQKAGTHMPAQTVAGGKGGKGDAAAFRGMGDEQRAPAHRNARALGLKNKDLIGIPWTLAFALRADGWYLRQDIIWHKPNPMPESVRDRCTKAHEYVFLLSKSDRYYYDSDAVKEACSEDMQRRAAAGHTRGPGGKVDMSRQDAATLRGDAAKAIDVSKGRNKRSVWTVAPRPYSGAHFAVYPPELITPCVLAGCPVGGVVLDPFGGSGTTAGVALAHGRNAILCELNPEYAALMPDRAKRIIDAAVN